LIVLRRLDLPAPLRPMIPNIDPRGIERSMSSKA
jgi:hypothetical protein